MFSKVLKNFAFTFLIFNVGFAQNLDLNAFSTHPLNSNLSKEKKDTFNEYKSIIEKIKQSNTTNNTAKSLVLNSILLGSMCLVPNGLSSDSRTKILCLKVFIFLVYPLLKKSLNKDSEFTKNLSKLKACLKKAIEEKHLDKKNLKSIIKSFKKNDKTLISKKFSRLKSLSLLSDSFMLFEGGRFLFLTSLLSFLGYDWVKNFAANFLTSSIFYKACFYFLSSLAYYQYCKFICNDVFNSKESKTFKDIENLINSAKTKKT